jgi:hypothetical protein
MHFAVPASTYMYSFDAILEVERGTLLSFSLLKRNSSSDSGHLARTRQREREQHGAFNLFKILPPACIPRYNLFFYYGWFKKVSHLLILVDSCSISDFLYSPLHRRTLTLHLSYYQLIKTRLCLPTDTKSANFGATSATLSPQYLLLITFNKDLSTSANSHVCSPSLPDGNKNTPLKNSGHVHFTYFSHKLPTLSMSGCLYASPLCLNTTHLPNSCTPLPPSLQGPKTPSKAIPPRSSTCPSTHQ